MVGAPLSHPWGFLSFTLGLRLASTLVLSRRQDAPHALRTAARSHASSLAVLPQTLRDIEQSFVARGIEFTGDTGAPGVRLRTIAAAA